MKSYFLILLFLLTSCENKPKTHLATASSITIDTTLHTTADSVHIILGDARIISYGKQEFNDIVDSFPELHSQYPMPPDIAYPCKTFTSIKNSEGVVRNTSFGSEAGQDQYYALYAYFLQKRDTGVSIAGMRDTLSELYSAINEIYEQLNYGGTYYAHMTLRIWGYLEYDIYQQTHGGYQPPPYDIAKQKALYIALLKQMIADAESIDNETHELKAKAERKINLYQIADRISSLIVNPFYLHRVQQFQFTNYRLAS